MPDAPRFVSGAPRSLPAGRGAPRQRAGNGRKERMKSAYDAEMIAGIVEGDVPRGFYEKF